MNIKRFFYSFLILFFLGGHSDLSAQVFTFECKCEHLISPDCDICNTNVLSRRFNGLLIYRNGTPYRWIDYPYTMRKLANESIQFLEQIPNPENITIAKSQTAFFTMDGYVDSTTCNCGGSTIDSILVLNPPIGGNGITTPLYIVAGGITTTEILNGTILGADLNQMSATSGQVLKWNGTTWAAANDENSGGTVLGTGSAGQVSYWSNSTTLTGSNNLFFDGTKLGVYTATAAESIEIGSSGTGLKLPAIATTPTDRTLYYTNKDILKFGPTKEIEKATTYSLSISQNTNWTAGDYWDVLSISFLAFGYSRITIESSGNAHGSFRQIEIPISYANDVWNSFAFYGTDNTWYLLSENTYLGRDWGSRFNDQFKLAIRVNGGTVEFRLVAVTSGEIRGAPFDYGNATVTINFYLSRNSSLDANPSVLATSGTGMTVPTTYLPSVLSGPNGRTIFRNGMTVGENYKDDTPPSNGMLIEGNVAIGATTAARKLHVAGEVRVADLITDTPTQIVGADADGDLGVISLGTGLSFSAGSLAVTNGLPSGTSGHTLRHNGSAWVSNSFLYNSGTKIGVNTASPNAEVHNSGGDYGAYKSGGASLYLGDLNFNNSGYYNLTPGLSAVFNATQGVTSDLGLYYYSGSTRALGAILSASGFFGIGASTPARMLDVNGEVRVRDLTTDTPTRIVGADGDGDLGAITVGSGLSLSGGSLTASGGGVPAGTSGQTLRNDGAGWAANSFLYNTGAGIGIGTTSLTQTVEIAGTVGITNTTSGANSYLLVDHTSNTANSNAIAQIRTAGASGGDPVTQYSIAGVETWSAGLDNSDSDKFKIAKNATPGTNDYFTITSTGLTGVGTASPTTLLHVNGSFRAGFAAGSSVSDIDDVFIGNNAGTSATSATESVFVGKQAGSGATSARNSIFAGYQCGYGATGASYSIFQGYSAGNTATGATRSIFLGYAAGYIATSAQYSNFIGSNAGNASTSAEYSNFIGAEAGQNSPSATYANFIGYQAGKGHTTGGTNSVMIGRGAGAGITTGTGNTIIGGQIASLSAGLTGTVILGNGTGDVVMYATSTATGIGTITPGANRLFLVSPAGSSRTALRASVDAQVGNNMFVFEDLSGNNFLRLTYQSGYNEMIATGDFVINSTTSLQVGRSGSYAIFDSGNPVQIINTNGVSLSAVASDPSSPIPSQFWYNTTGDGAFKYRNDVTATIRTIANIEDDIKGSGSTINTATTHTLGTTAYEYVTKYDALSNAITVTCDGTMREGFVYWVKCRRNATNAITFNAGSGYTFSIDEDSTLSPTTFTPNAHETIQFKRIGTVIEIDR